MRILWIKVGGLWPCNTGGRLRSFHLLRELSRHHRITLLTSDAASDHQQNLRTQLPQCEEVLSFVHRIPKWRSPRFAAALARSWLSPMPVDLWRLRVGRLRAEASRRLAEGTFDLCVADFLAAMPSVTPGSRVPLLLFEHNVEHLIWKRLAGVESRPWRRAVLALEWRKLRRYEATACARATLTLAVSPVDRALLAELSPGAAVQDVATGVDTEFFRPGEGEEAPGEIVYVGSMDWQPNEDAVLYWLREILPQVRRAQPAVHFTVVGRNPGAKLRRAAARAGITLTGTVPDVRPYLRRAAVCVVPLRIGGGTRLKIFEALAMGKAVVSTSIGAEGLPLTDGRHFFRADEPAAFANAVIALLRDAPRRHELGRAGCDLVQQRFSWPRVAQQFESLCAHACGWHADAAPHTVRIMAEGDTLGAHSGLLPGQLQQRR